MDAPERDEFDDLLSRASPPAPRGLSTRVFRRARVERLRVGLLAALLLDALALCSLGVVALLLGRALGSGEARELILLGVQDRSVVSASPTEYAQALAQTIPWQHLLVLVVDVLSVILLTRYLLRATDLPNRAGS